MQDFSIRTIEPRHAAAVRFLAPQDGLGPAFESALPRVWAALERAGTKPSGPPFARYLTGDPAAFDVEAGFIVAEPFAGVDDVHAVELPAGESAVSVYTGPYQGLPAAWDALFAWMESQGRHMRSPGWESYVSDPGPDVDPATLVTEICIPIE